MMHPAAKPAETTKDRRDDNMSKNHEKIARTRIREEYARKYAGKLKRKDEQILALDRDLVQGGFFGQALDLGGEIIDPGAKTGDLLVLAF